MTNGLLCIGDNVVDLYLDRGEFFPGGNALNVAVLARRFGLADVAYMGIVGNDREGDHVRACMAAEGLSTAHLRRVEGPNGKAQVTHDADGDRVFVASNRGGIRRKLMLRMDEDDLALIAAKGHVHSSCFSYLEPELPRIRASAREVSFDFSTLHDPAYLEQVCPHVTTAFLSGAGLQDTAVSALIGRVLDLGPDTVCVTRGDKGAVWPMVRPASNSQLSRHGGRHDGRRRCLHRGLPCGEIARRYSRTGSPTCRLLRSESLRMGRRMGLSARRHSIAHRRCH